MARVRGKRRRYAGAATVARIERGGHRALAAVWSVLVRVVVVPLVAALAHGWSWFQAQARWVQLVLVLLVAGGVAGFHLVDGSVADTVYLDDETEALARVIRSEIGIGTPQQRVHIAWATRNLATERGQTVAQMACSPCGPQVRGRPVSSRQEATDADRRLAHLVLKAPSLLDPTGGATHFINPQLQDELARRGVRGYAGRTYERVRRTWSERYGWEPYYRLGPDLELWGKKRSARKSP